MTLGDLIEIIKEERLRTSKRTYKHPVKGKQLKNYLK